MIRFLTAWGPALLVAGVIFYLSSQPVVPAESWFPVSDKVAHVLIFAVLGTALAWAGRGISGSGFHAGLILLGILYGATDEWHQSFVPLRDPSAGDLAADALGVVVGYLLALILLRRRHSRG